MVRTTVHIEGMSCGMCEAHIAETIRRAFPTAKKVKASHKKGSAIFETEQTVDTERLKQAIDATGYTFLSAASEEIKRKGLFAR